MIAKGAGQSLHAYAREALFDPAGGIGATEWVNGEDGNESAASGLRMTPRDLARVGQSSAIRSRPPMQWMMPVGLTSCAG